jgi:hypothetical protein
MARVSFEDTNPSPHSYKINEDSRGCRRMAVTSLIDESGTHRVTRLPCQGFIVWREGGLRVNSDDDRVIIESRQDEDYTVDGDDYSEMPTPHQVGEYSSGLRLTVTDVSHGCDEWYCVPLSEGDGFVAFPRDYEVPLYESGVIGIEF